MADSGAWYLKLDDGTVYGPVDLNRLRAWAREGRMEASSRISSDRKSWTLASLMPELGMEWIVEVEMGQYYGPFHLDVIRDLILQERIPASARRFRLDTGRVQEDQSKELNAALAKAKASLAELEAALAEQKTLVAGLRNQEAGLAAKLEESLKESKSAAAASDSRIEELETALKDALVRETALRTDLDLAHKTAATERKCVETALRRQRQAEKALEEARKDAEDLRVKMRKDKERSKAAKGKGGLFQGVSSSDLAFLEQAARRELAFARGRSTPAPRPQPKALDVIDV